MYVHEQYRRFLTRGTFFSDLKVWNRSRLLYVWTDPIPINLSPDPYLCGAYLIRDVNGVELDGLVHSQLRVMHRALRLSLRSKNSHSDIHCAHLHHHMGGNGSDKQLELKACMFWGHIYLTRSRNKNNILI